MKANSNLFHLLDLNLESGSHCGQTYRSSRVYAEAAPLHTVTRARSSRAMVRTSNVPRCLLHRALGAECLIYLPIISQVRRALSIVADTSPSLEVIDVIVRK